MSVLPGKRQIAEALPAGVATGKSRARRIAVTIAGGTRVASVGLLHLANYDLPMQRLEIAPDWLRQ